ncbi:MAG: helix-turn-helix transcriptional regulator [Burkholderiales bacterium]|nr:helix-turn-helix transcriptional regulator [Burkholderiales bacterium]
MRHHHYDHPHHRAHRHHFDGDREPGHDGLNMFERLAHHLRHHAMGRHHRGGRDGGPFGGFGFGRGDGEGFPRGRKFTSEDLQLLLLALLAEKPAHGYELIKALEARSNGFYTPSPGMVYPALTYLEELGHVSVTLDGNRKCYALAEEGRTYLAENQARVDAMLERLSHIAQKMDSVRRAFSGEASAEDADETGPWLPELMEARRMIKYALFTRSNASAEEQRRIADILQHAARLILDK